MFICLSGPVEPFFGMNDDITAASGSSEYVIFETDFQIISTRSSKRPSPGRFLLHTSNRIGAVFFVGYFSS
jgi:hypothetical protein